MESQAGTSESAERQASAPELLTLARELREWTVKLSNLLGGIEGARDELIVVEEQLAEREQLIMGSEIRVEQAEQRLAELEAREVRLAALGADLVGAFGERAPAADDEAAEQNLSARLNGANQHVPADAVDSENLT